MSEKSSRDIRQEECVKAWINNKCKGVLECCTGFGCFKVLTGFSYNNFVNIYTAVPIEESLELQEGKLGED